MRKITGKQPMWRAVCMWRVLGELCVCGEYEASCVYVAGCVYVRMWRTVCLCRAVCLWRAASSCCMPCARVSLGPVTLFYQVRVTQRPNGTHGLKALPDAIARSFVG